MMESLTNELYEKGLGVINEVGKHYHRTIDLVLQYTGRLEKFIKEMHKAYVFMNQAHSVNQ